jgi:hypothetical protein
MKKCLAFLGGFMMKLKKKQRKSQRKTLMKNKDKYTTPIDREAAFDKFCSRHSCSYCPVARVANIPGAGACGIYWLELEATEESGEDLNEETDKELGQGLSQGPGEKSVVEQTTERFDERINERINEQSHLTILGDGIAYPTLIHVKLDGRVVYPILESIRGDDSIIIIPPTVSCPCLKTIEGYVEIYEGSEVPNLESIRGNIFIRRGAYLPNLTHIGGAAFIDPGAKVPKLKTVGIHSHISEGVYVPKLETVGGNIYLY